MKRRGRLGCDEGVGEEDDGGEGAGGDGEPGVADGWRALVAGEADEEEVAEGGGG